MAHWNPLLRCQRRAGVEKRAADQQAGEPPAANPSDFFTTAVLAMVYGTAVDYGGTAVDYGLPMPKPEGICFCRVNQVAGSHARIYADAVHHVGRGAGAFWLYQGT